MRVRVRKTALQRKTLPMNAALYCVYHIIIYRYKILSAFSAVDSTYIVDVVHYRRYDVYVLYEIIILTASNGDIMIRVARSSIPRGGRTQNVCI